MDLMSMEQERWFSSDDESDQNCEFKELYCLTPQTCTKKLQRKHKERAMPPPVFIYRKSDIVSTSQMGYSASIKILGWVGAPKTSLPEVTISTASKENPVLNEVDPKQLHDQAARAEQKVRAKTHAPEVSKSGGRVSLNPHPIVSSPPLPAITAETDILVLQNQVRGLQMKLSQKETEWVEEKSRILASHKAELTSLTHVWNHYLEKMSSKWEEKKSGFSDVAKAAFKLKERCKQEVQQKSSQWAEERSRILATHQKKTFCLVKTWDKKIEKDQLVSEHLQENSNLRAMWKEDRKHHWSHWAEKSHILASHETSCLIKNCNQDFEERCQWKEEKDRLVSEHLEETSKIKALWIQDVAQKQSQWAEEKSRLTSDHMKKVDDINEAWFQELDKNMTLWQREEIRLNAEHMMESSNLKTRLLKMQDHMENLKLQWHEEKSRLLERIFDLKAVMGQKEEEKMAELVRLENRITEILNTQKAKDKKKGKSFKKRFIGSFKKIKKAPSSSDT